MLWADLRICLFADTQALVREYTNRGYRYQTTCSILTPANKAALKALAIAEGGLPWCQTEPASSPKETFSAASVMEECLISVVSMSSLRSVWALLRSKVQKMVRPMGGEIKRSLRRSYKTLICNNF